MYARYSPKAAPNKIAIIMDHIQNLVDIVGSFTG